LIFLLPFIYDFFKNYIYTKDLFTKTFLFNLKLGGVIFSLSYDIKVIVRAIMEEKCFWTSLMIFFGKKDVDI